MNIPLQRLLPFPKSVEAIINKHYNSVSNINLLLTKYVKDWKINWEFESKEKGEYISYAIKVNYDKTLYPNFLKRWDLMLNTINAVKVKGKVLWRLIVGLGSGSVLETSMTLHHTLGVPYIPGSAVKGVVDAYYLEKNREKLEEQMKKSNNGEKYKDIEYFAMDKDELYIKIFGNQSQRGKVIFLDAYPSTFPKLEMDIMNPHFGDYYSSKRDSRGKPIPPADWLPTLPVKFVTVAKDTEFIFAFKSKEKDLTNEVKTLMHEAIENMGIGSKTSVGYGYFKNIA